MKICTLTYFDFGKKYCVLLALCLSMNTAFAQQMNWYNFIAFDALFEEIVIEKNDILISDSFFYQFQKEQYLLDETDKIIPVEMVHRLSGKFINPISKQDLVLQNSVLDSYLNLCRDNELEPITKSVSYRNDYEQFQMLRNSDFIEFPIADFLPMPPITEGTLVAKYKVKLSDKHTIYLTNTVFAGGYYTLCWLFDNDCHQLDNLFVIGGINFNYMLPYCDMEYPVDVERKAPLSVRKFWLADINFDNQLDVVIEDRYYESLQEGANEGMGCSKSYNAQFRVDIEELIDGKLRVVQLPEVL